MTNADRMTHPIIPQRNQYVTVEYLKSLGIDENFKVSTITLTNPTIKESPTIASQDNSDRITITQNISEFTSHGYVSIHQLRYKALLVHHVILQSLKKHVK